MCNLKLLFKEMANTCALLCRLPGASSRGRCEIPWPCAWLQLSLARKKAPSYHHVMSYAGTSGAAVCQKFNASDVPSWNYLKRGADWLANTAWTCALGVLYAHLVCIPMTSTNKKAVQAHKNSMFVGGACLQVRRLQAVACRLLSGHRCVTRARTTQDTTGTRITCARLSGTLVHADTRYVSVPASQSVRLGSPAVASAAVLVSLQLLPRIHTEVHISLL